MTSVCVVTFRLAGDPGAIRHHVPQADLSVLIRISESGLLPVCRQYTNLVSFSYYNVVCPKSLNVALAVVHAKLTCDSVAEDFWSSRQCPGEIPSHW